MHFLIDFDKLEVLSKSEDKELLDTFIEDNGLSLAIALIDGADELALEFSISEMHRLHTNIGSNGKQFDDEDEESEAIWEILEESEDDFPDFTKALGKKIAKGDGEKPTKGSTKSSKPKAAPKSKGIRAKDLMGMSFCKGPKDPRKGTSFEIFTSFLEDNLDEATFDELVAAFIKGYVPKNPKKPVDEALGRAYVRDAFNGGYIEEGL